MLRSSLVIPHCGRSARPAGKPASSRTLSPADCLSGPRTSTSASGTWSYTMRAVLPETRPTAMARQRGPEGWRPAFLSGMGSSASASASYTYLSTLATDDAGLPSATFAAGSRLIRRPQHSAEITLRGRVLSRATLGGSVSYTGARDDVDFREFPAAVVRLPAYTLVNVTADVDVIRAAPGRPGLSGMIKGREPVQ